jgi:hypothetical protein
VCGDVSIVTSNHVASNPFVPGQTTIPQNQQDPNHPITFGTRIEVSLIPSIQKDMQNGNLTGTVTIFDAVGNTIINKQAMSFDLKDPEHPKIFLTWDGKTAKGKFAGGGTYLARIIINDQYRNKTQTIRQNIGIKQAKK